MFSFRLAEQKDLKAVFELMEQAASQLSNPALFVPETRESLERHLEKEGRLLLAEEGRLAGYLLLRFPGSAPDNLAPDAGLSPAEALRCVHMESVAVHPHFRGRGLQKLLLRQGEELLPPEIAFSLATVAPENAPSLRSFLQLGYHIAGTKEKYGGKLRHILLKELGK